ncbi:hypothetical protein Q7P37_002277 [Cladosporium fusiforme]
MTIVHIVLFKFRPEISQAHRDLFASTLKKLKSLPCVKDHRLLVGGNSITTPIERSKGFQYALLSYHHDRKALQDYQDSKEHHEVTSELLFPFKEDLIRYDFEVAPEDEYMCDFIAKAAVPSGR